MTDEPNTADETGDSRPPPPAPGWTAIPGWGSPGAPPAQQPPSQQPPPPAPGWNNPAQQGGYPYGSPAPMPPGAYGYGYPGQPYGAPPIAKPDSNLVGAILVTLLCCLPFGIVAIVYAAQVDSKWNAGDWQGAQRASKLAKNWGLGAIGAGIAFALLYVLGISASSGGR